MHRWSIKAAALASLWFLALSCLYGFDFSDPKKFRQEIRQEILKELEKIKEKTPNARKRQKWRKSRDAANEALLNARFYQAARYAPEEWDQAVALFRQAKAYAVKRSYLKADYLARRALEYAKKAEEKARAAIEELESRLGSRYQELKQRLDEITAQVPSDAEELMYRASELHLALSDARLAIELRQFDDANQRLSQVEMQLTAFKRDLDRYLEEHPDLDIDMIEGQEGEIEPDEESPPSDHESDIIEPR